MVARAKLGLNLKVIASFDPRKPPEEIKLPKDIITPSIITARFMPSVVSDVITHLLGTDTNIPQYFSIVQFPAPRHCFIASAESHKANALRRLIPRSTYHTWKLK